ncbi:MAG TPA: SpoIVB peptidase S55 domain-containing protein, partial [Terriglobia bacterium]|nr:SpoIVB peptidase S55 domain-containing protein [Terriglobia bacterium]
MRTWRAATALGIFLLCAVAVPAQDTSDFFPSAEVRPGLKGVGRTIFEGDKVEEFQVEFLGVLKNVLAPKRDIILARLSGGPLEKTGVIAGMSGSPVYVDGKLVGAIALSFPFSKEPLAGITPIGEMLDVAPTAAPPSASHPAPAMNLNYRISRDAGEGERLVLDENNTLAGLADLFPADGAPFLPDNLRLPLKFGGFSPSAVEASAPLLRRLGFEPMLGGALAASPTDTPMKGDIQPGSMISMLLVRGDLNVNADCTVTYRKGNQLYACGHRFLMAGPADIPFAK